MKKAVTSPQFDVSPTSNLHVCNLVEETLFLIQMDCKNEGMKGRYTP